MTRTMAVAVAVALLALLHGAVVVVAAAADAVPAQAHGSAMVATRVKRNLGGSFLSPDGLLRVAWLFLQEDLISWEVTAAHDGWAGIGFSYDPSMTNTDFVVGFFNGTAFDLQDRFTHPAASDGHGFPPPDVALGGTNDLIEPSGSLVEGSISFTFKRKVNTTDPFDRAILQGEMYLLYAYGPVQNGVPGYHSNQRRAVPIHFYPKFGYSSPDGVWKAAWSFSNTNDVVTFELTSTFDGWLGLGISETGKMQSTDFVVAWYDDANARVEAVDRFADPAATDGHGFPKSDVELGGVNDIFNISGSKVDVDGQLTTTVKFSRRCITGDVFDVNVTNRNIFLLYAYGPLSNGLPSYHGATSRGSAPVNFQFEITQPSDGKVNFFTVHGCLMALSWSLMIVPMAIFARYYKISFPQWFAMHWMVNTLALILVSVAFILVVIEKQSFGNSAHAIIGLIVLILAILQGMIGQSANQSWFEGKIPTFWPDKVHWYLGHLLVALCLVNVMLGLDRFGVSTIPYATYASYIGVTLLLIIYLEIRVGQTGESERINDDPGNAPPLVLFLVYWVISASLVSVALGFTFAA